jgi:two-component system, LytTR family, response regulator
MSSSPERAGRERLRVLIVDDEPLARDCVRLALEREPDMEVIGQSDTGVAAATAIRELAPDLVFLDIQMPDLDGFGVVESVGPEHMPEVVFVTAYDAFALRAFRVHALDYVLKPFDDVRFSEAVQRARVRIDGRRHEELGRKLASMLGERFAESPEAHGSRNQPSYVSRFTVRDDDDRVRFVAAASVDWIETQGNYVILHAGATAHRVRTPLSTLVRSLDPRMFAQVHRCAVVNIERVRELQPWFGGDYVAILHDGSKLRVSRARVSALLKPMQ